METQPTSPQGFNSDLRNRLALIAAVPVLCLVVLAFGGLIFLGGSTGVRVFGVFALLGVAVSAVLAYRGINSILESIGSVAASAQKLVNAQEALLDDDPGPIESWTRIEEESDDELGRLAASINTLHANSVSVGHVGNDSIKEGISTIVVNLARRSQTLLDRQVEYIDALESSEEDPDRLEQMFKVDHLATRMRRNAESLLVLAEADPGRRRGGPVDIADVLRVAMGEIENYTHIQLSSVEPGQVTSTAAMDLAHLAAELMENATQFSPPDIPVSVAGRLEGDHYLVSIVDRGVGMSPEQLTAANETIADPPELGLAMGRSLGFVVIGRLAQRLGAAVRLFPTDESGVTARIEVPTSAFSQLGDNRGVRRSIVAPDVTDAPEEAPATGTPSGSPALTKLLGLDPAAAGQSPATDVAPPTMAPGSPTPMPTRPAGSPSPVSPSPVSPSAPVVESAPIIEPASPAETGWTPPPVTPDAPPPRIAGVGGAPSKLDEAIPTGEDFNSGMASLLDPASAPSTPLLDPFDSDGADVPGADGQSTTAGLTKRRRGESKVPIGEGRPVAASSRKPEEIRSMLSRYREGIKGNPSPTTDPREDA